MSVIDDPMYARFLEASHGVLVDPDAALSLRVSCGLLMLQLIAMRATTGTRELCNPLEHAESRAIRRALYEPIQLLAALAESRNIDSTPIMQLHAVRYFDELEEVEPLLDRLELIECGPDLDCSEGEKERRLSRINGANTAAVKLGTEGRARRRTDAEKKADEIAAANYIRANPEAKQQDIADALGLSRGTVSIMRVWRMHSKQKRVVSKANRATPGGSMSDM